MMDGLIQALEQQLRSLQGCQLPPETSADALPSQLQAPLFPVPGETLQGFRDSVAAELARVRTIVRLYETETLLAVVQPPCEDAQPEPGGKPGPDSA